ncbi:hypothetical protein DSM112329_04599 [Paraconexibacter sp. AEG42_29]|uniref:Prokaryotic cytochrome C oxidase subunit IV family protein n=1 Tax=Paraconexibacter sp. AEG42_29 TaxID=2997339 RepID=A0AAU7B1B9_9ACTN
MAALLRTRLFAVYVVLVAATCVSWILGADHGSGSHTTVAAIVLVVAFVKVWLVGHEFMELGGALQPLKGIFEAYVVVVLAVLLVLYNVV